MRRFRGVEWLGGLGLALAVAGCHRGPNVAAVTGIRVSPAGYEPGSERTEGRSNAGVLGQVGLTGRGYDLRDGISGRGGLDLFFGGNTSGPAAELSGGVAVGPALLLETEHALFTRAAVDFELERSPYSGSLSLELPSLEAGYAFHGTDDGHLELYGKMGLAIAGSAYAGPEVAAFLAAPELGGAAVAYGPGMALEVGYTHVFEGPPLDVVRTMGCLGVLLVVCGDARVTRATYFAASGSSRELTGYYGGVTFGAGAVWGRE